MRSQPLSKFLMRPLFTMNALTRRPKRYEDAKRDFDIAVQEYDQAIWDLTLSQVLKTERERHSEELLEWLSASYWLVESRLQDARDKRAPGTLKWAHREQPFKTWRTSEKGSVLWIRGGPGIGKSTLAGYFIDELKRQYRKSVIAYFFCGREEPGLSDVRDVIRTIAYQCAIRSPKAMNALKKLMTRSFSIEQRVSVHLMITKLLEEPLNETTEDVYIVIDGLDGLGHTLASEVQSSGSDAGNNRAQERNELIQYLGELVAHQSSGSGIVIRLLLVSRPEVDVQRFLPKSELWLFDYDDNASDIRLFVNQQLCKFDGELQTCFDAVKVDPLIYFRDNARGLFLWVSTVLGQLSAVKFQETFSEQLDQFSQASGDMNKVYLDIFARINENDRIWVSEVVKWLALAQRVMTINELQAAVEFDMGNHFMKSKFMRFLDVECGSLVRYISFRESSCAILIHETLFSFLTGSSTCPSDFRVDIVSAREDAANTCLQVLCRKDDDIDHFREYSARFWITYLDYPSSASSSKVDFIAMSIFELFTSQSLTRWIELGLLTEDSADDELPIYVEEEGLRIVTSWLQQWSKRHTQEIAISGSSLFQEALRWSREIAGNLGAYIGKAAAKLWISGDLDNRNRTKGAFRLAIKHYWRRIGRSTSKFEELRELSITQFKALMTWAGLSPEDSSLISNCSLGDAYFVIHRWDEAIVHYKRAVLQNDDKIELWQLVSSSYKRKLTLDGATDFFESMIRKFPFDTSARYSLAQAYEEMRNFDKAINAYNSLIEMTPGWMAWVGLGNVYEMREDYDGAIAVYKRALDKLPIPPTAWLPEDVQHDMSVRMAKAYVSKGDLDEALKLYKMLLQAEPNATQPRAGVAKVYELRGLLEEAIGLYETWIEDNAKAADAWIGLIELYKQKQDYDGAIQVYQTWHHRDPTSELPLLGLGQLYYSDGQFEKAIQCYSSIQEASMSETAWKYFGLSYAARGEFDNAITLYNSFLEKNPRAMDVWLTLVEVQKQKGDFDGATAESVKSVELYEKLLEEFPTDPAVLGRLGVRYYAQGELNRAIQMFEAAVELSRASAWCLKLGHAYRAIGELNQAIMAYEKSTKFVVTNHSVTRLADLEHWVGCDGCSVTILGIWHKCLVCYNYDLCDNCHKRVSTLHPQHDFFDLPSEEGISRFNMLRDE